MLRRSAMVRHSILMSVLMHLPSCEKRHVYSSSAKLGPLGLLRLMGTKSALPVPWTPLSPFGSGRNAHSTDMLIIPYQMHSSNKPTLVSSSMFHCSSFYISFWLFFLDGLFMPTYPFLLQRIHSSTSFSTLLTHHTKHLPDISCHTTFLTVKMLRFSRRI